MKSAKPAPDRFWAKVDRKTPSECWEWTAYCDKNGYGRFGVTSKDIRWAHRYSYELTYGEIPEGKFILHSCDNPKCVNPNHLRAGTHAENMQDAVDRHRMVQSHATMSRDEVADLRSAAASGVDFKTLAKRYNLTEGHVRSICRGDFRKDVDGPLIKKRAARKSVGCEAAREIRSLHAKGMKQKEIAVVFNCSVQCVNGIIKNRVYKE